MSIARWIICASIAALAGGCSSGVIADLPTWAGGLPPNAPERPAIPAAYPAVHDMPADRGTHVLTPDEQERLEKDLEAQRARTVAGTPAAKSTTKAAQKAPGAGAGSQRQP